jgi:hypothetical protein
MIIGFVWALGYKDKNLVFVLIDPALATNDFSSSGFIYKTYTDFISEARVFYKEYLKLIEAEGLAV